MAEAVVEPGLVVRGSSNRLVFVDALRGVASVWVLLFHAEEGQHLNALFAKTPEFVRQFFQAGWLGVPIFFVLSGYVIAQSLRKDPLTGRGMARFALRRSIRLDPPYWASIVLTLAFAYVSSRVVRGKPPVHVHLSTIAAHVFYAQELLQIPAINVVYWTLCLEVQFYLIFYILLIACRRLGGEAWSQRIGRIFIPAALVSLLWPLGIVRANLWPGLFLPMWHGFLLGAFANWLGQGVIRNRTFYGYAAILALTLTYRPDAFTACCIVTAVILVEVGRAGKLESWLRWRWLQFTGRISYSLYLIHNPVTGAAAFLLVALLGKSAAAQAIALPALIAINLTAAWVFWYLIERPSMRLSSKLRTRSTAPQPAPTPTPLRPVGT